MKKFAGFVVFALLQFGFVFDAFAFINNAFEVNGVSVSANSVSSSEARGKALVGARSIAFKKVLNRLLDTESLEKVIIPESANIEKFVQTYKIANEKTTSTGM